MNRQSLFRGTVFTGALLAPLLSASSASALEEMVTYPETKAVLLEIHRDEVKALTSYLTFADRAVEEGYPKIAALFKALSASETVHAKNMKDVLAELGVAVWEPPPEMEALTTKENLERAMAVELSEINEGYPTYLERIAPEDYQPAVDVITYAWEAEKQHRALLRKIHSYVGSFFGAVAKKIEGAPSSYYVCDICGSTTREPPKEHCGICGDHSSHVHAIPEAAPAP